MIVLLGEREDNEEDFEETHSINMANLKSLTDGRQAVVQDFYEKKFKQTFGKIKLDQQVIYLAKSKEQKLKEAF